MPALTKRESSLVEPHDVMTMVAGGEVPEEARRYARKRLGSVIERIPEPVLFARVKLTQAPDPAVERSAIAQVTVDVNGEIVRARRCAHDMREAIDLLQARLRDKLDHRAQHRHASRRRPASSPPGQWRHGDAPSDRPPYFDRPADERELVRHKSFATSAVTPDEAAFDMDQLDFDFYLFQEEPSGGDALLERLSDGSYRLTRVPSPPIETGRTAVDLAVSEHPAPVLEVDEAIERISAGGERFVFFENAASRRGNVIYRRYDGHYGLLAPQ
jgi:ribosome-associated translation inhibitor RaiA